VVAPVSELDAPYVTAREQIERGAENSTRVASLILIVILLAATGASLLLSQFLSGPIVRLTNVAEQVTAGDLGAQAKVESADETGTLANAFNRMTAQLREFIATLESRVTERTRNLELAAEVGRTVSQVRALDVMLTDAAELIRKQFNLYYAQVYLVDPTRNSLNLQAGTGEVGVQLLARSHRLPFDNKSINGRAAVEKKSVVIPDTAASATFKPNPLLPDTRSEMAVPLLVGDQVVGVLDMQSEQAGLLNNENLPAFEALAGQLAIAIQNASYLSQAEQARSEVETQARQLSRSNWAEYLDAIHKPEALGFTYEKNKIVPLTTEEKVADALAAPISISGERLGELVVEMDERQRSSQMEQLIFAVARQVAQQIENLRLLDSAERFRYEAEQASRRLIHEGWEEYLNTNAPRELGYIYDLKEVRPCRENEIRQTDAALDLPLKVQDETIGKLVVQDIETGNEEAAALVHAVAERLGEHIEGLRLSQQTEQALAATRRQAQREQALRQITSAVRGSNDPAIILRTAARELGNILGRQTVVKLATAGETKAGPADHPVEAAGETVADNGNESVSPADRS
jgi:GAF domain-containing protein/HAMP domain-containing protein